MLTARAPAKLILSGEYSVLEGQPALAMAINRYTATSASWSEGAAINFNLADLAYVQARTADNLQLLINQLQQKYLEFTNGQANIRSVLQQPFELVQYTVGKLINNFNLKLARGLDIAINSSIPVGCGLGSSAAVIISTLYALANLLKLNWQPAAYLDFARQIENLQHGKSSGVDLHLVTHGGCVLFENNLTQARAAPKMPMYMINTGQPAATTGECVAKVAGLFKANPALSQDFGAVTRALDTNIKSAIQENHRLLTRIGVVPTKVAKLIADLEKHGGAAKICGAGSIHGDNAGMVLLISEQDLQPVVAKHGYSLEPIQVDQHGVTIV